MHLFIINRRIIYLKLVELLSCSGANFTLALNLQDVEANSLAQGTMGKD